MSLKTPADSRDAAPGGRVTAALADHATRISTLEGNVGTLAGVDTALAAADTALGTRLVVLETRSGLHVCFHAVSSAQSSWSAMPAAATLLNGHHRHISRAVLTGFSQARLHVNKMGTAGFAGAKWILRYSTVYGTTAATFTADAGTTEIACAIDATDTFVSSSWTNLAALAKADVFLAIVGSGGNGVITPQYGGCYAEFR